MCQPLTFMAFCFRCRQFKSGCLVIQIRIRRNLKIYHAEKKNCCESCRHVLDWRHRVIEDQLFARTL